MAEVRSTTAAPSSGEEPEEQWTPPAAAEAALPAGANKRKKGLDAQRFEELCSVMLGDDVLDSEDLADEEEEEEETVTEVKIKYKHAVYPISVGSNSSYLEFQEAVHRSTGVTPKHQKLIGLNEHYRKISPDSTSFLKEGSGRAKPITLVGSEIQDIQKVEKVETDGSVIDDFDVPSFSSIPTADLRVMQLRKLESTEKAIASKKSEQLSTKFFHRRNPSKPIIFFSLRLFCSFFKPPQGEGERRPPLCVFHPGTHEFLTMIYRYYDIGFWDRVSLATMIKQVNGAGMLSQIGYKVCCLMDKSWLVELKDMRNRKPVLCKVKPLELLFHRYPHYFNGTNTIVMDWSHRSSVLNPFNSMIVEPFMGAKGGEVEEKNPSRILMVASFLKRIQPHVLKRMEGLLPKWEEHPYKWEVGVVFRTGHRIWGRGDGVDRPDLREIQFRFWKELVLASVHAHIPLPQLGGKGESKEGEGGDEEGEGSLSASKRQRK